MPYRSFHFWHHRGQPDMELYQKNLQLFNQFKMIDDKNLEAYINNSRPKIGLSNRLS
jgi:hypothetical protein